MGIILFNIYIIIIFANIISGLNARKYKILQIVSYIFLIYLLWYNFDFLCMNNHDLMSYKAQYLYYNPMEDESFYNYYIFYILMRFGQKLSISFEMWWLITMVISFIILNIATNIHRINAHVFISSFMIYYFFVLYTGLKFYYGFCFFLLGFGFILRGGKKNKIIYLFMLCIAGGFHIMYYFFLIFLLVDNDKQRQNNKKLIKIIVGISLIGSVILRMWGSANVLLGNIFAFLNSDTVDGYFKLNTKYGFYISVIMQLLCLECARRYVKICKRNSEKIPTKYGNMIYMCSLLTVLFYPFFMVSLTFLRLITSFSLALIVMTTYEFFKLNLRERKKIILFAGIIILGFYCRQMIAGNLWETSVVPIFFT